MAYATGQFPWLVTFSEGDACGATSLEEAIALLRAHRDGFLWQRADFAVTFPDGAATPPPPKRARRKRKESPDVQAAKTDTPAVPVQARPSGDVLHPSDLGSAGGHTQRDDAAPAAPASAPSISCGGKRCRDKGGVEVHDANDLACEKMHPKRRMEAVR